jgi:hypothetical protein
MNKFILPVLLICSMLIHIGCNFFQQKSSLPFPNKKIAFTYHKLTDNDITYLSDFDIIVTGAIIDRETVKRLKIHGAKLFYYDWLPAFYYCEHHDNWEEMVYQNRYYWTLDPKDSDPNPLGERYNCTDLFYDMADDGLVDARVDHIVYTVQINGYDGVFFDWGSGWNAFKENGYDFLIKEFQKRHPDIKYNEYVKKFLGKIKKKGLLIMLNGGFRSDQAELDTYADFDIVESMFTTTECHNPQYEIFIPSEGPVNACDTWFNTAENSLRLATQLPDRAKAVNPDITFLFLNYSFPYYRETGQKTVLRNKEYRVYEKTTDRQALFYSLACSYMGNSPGFTNGPDVSLEYVKDDVYFHSLGNPAGKVLKAGSGVYVKYFSKGIVVLSNGDAAVEIPVPKQEGIYDLYEKKFGEIKNGKLMVNLVSQVYPSGSKYPIGRIYLYDKH